MSIEAKRWAQLAQELNFQQLMSARKQAEGWRTGLTGLTAVLTTVLIIKGRDNVSDLASTFRWIVVVLLGMTLALLVTAALLSVRAASGAPSAAIRLTGENLRIWTRMEVRTVGRLIRWAAALTVAAICTLSLAVGITWTAPTARTTAPYVEVILPDGSTCGQLLSAAHGNLLLTGGIRLIPLTHVLAMNLVGTCS
jgi:hypothetical protein